MRRHGDDTESIIMSLGELFGYPDIAREVLEEFGDFIKEDQDPLAVSWSMFIELLDAYDVLASAFEKAWEQNNIVGFAISKGMTVQDAEDISQKVAMAAWRQIYGYKPWLASWNNWIFAIARNQIRKFFRDMKKDMECEDYDDLEIETDDEIEIDKLGIGVRETSISWMRSGNKGMAKFGAAMFLLYHNWDWFEPTSAEMCRITGMSKTSCYRHYHNFIREAKSCERRLK